ncbi:MAG: FAD-dependent oxidoreductase [Gemmatimonadota bacterium]|nr:FAD-dependent oxidoreductase [Gemmatimonadota bacterium]MDH3368244.1 FAD-dependent oxidoreductase [Gemmatimonadota bacterium]MDH3478523.1 FAD-dependent oxidoreductase [Gemmatimonadota bacterium]MDH5548426.1 FAD-dependent oxidoreductase [Gemmatimonadota bacterium]
MMHATEWIRERVMQVSRARPLRVAIVGSGPAGFYTAEHLFKRGGDHVHVDMFERLPTPFGLVRFGVAPDHQKIKKATKSFERIAANPRFRLFGNVEYGEHVRLEDLASHYHAICFATGAQTDRSMNIPGEDLARSHPATDFVAWYNGHPAFRDREFDLSVERVAVVGVGNVAVDVARILSRTPEELEQTDIADYALASLRESRVKEIYVLGRRGPAQAAFTNPEIKELGELAGADFVIPFEDVTLDPLSAAEMAKSEDRALLKKVEILQDAAWRSPAGKPRRLTLRFLVSPVELMGDTAGQVAGMRIVRNELYRSDDGTLRPRATGLTEDLAVELVFRSVGYRGVPLPGVPFDDRRGVVPNQEGRVIDPATGEPVPGLYVSGWIKRGATGVIGTNKPDAGETVERMLDDVERGAVPNPGDPDPAAIEALVRDRQPACVSLDDWTRLDEIEVRRGAKLGRPRLKFTSAAEVARALGRS